MIHLGDAVITKTGPADQPVMTVYDLTEKYSVAHCNWLEGTVMHKRILPLDHLRAVRRVKPKGTRA
jgi:hypothetical protein